MKDTLNKNWVIFSTVLLGFGAIWIWVTRANPDEVSQTRISAPQEGLLAPDFTLSTLDGKEISLVDYRGSPVLVNLWASWCPPCRKEMPDIQKAYETYTEQGLVILAVNATHEDNLNSVKEFVEKNNLSFPIPLDTTGEVNRLYNLHSLPTTYFINRNGIIEKIIIGGPMRFPTIEKHLNGILEGGQ